MHLYVKGMLAVLLMAAQPMVAVAQPSLPQTNGIVQIEVGEDEAPLEVFSTDRDGQKAYYLSVGSLFIPLGTTLDDAEEALGRMDELFGEPQGATMTVEGCLNIAFPKDETAKVTVTHRRALMNNALEFSLRRADSIRSTQVQKSDFNSLLSGLRIYRRMHRSEK